MIEISVVIPILNEAGNIALLSQKIREVLSMATPEFEIIFVDGGSRDDTTKIAQEIGARVLLQSGPGFGQAILDGLSSARGEFIVTMDADFSHPPEFIPTMLKQLSTADLIIASRYIKGGGSKAGWLRSFISRSLCFFFSYGLAIPVKDITSGFRVIKREIVSTINIRGREFEVEPEIVINAYAKGWRIKEVPFYYEPRRFGKSHISSKIFKLARGYLKVFWMIYRKRGFIDFADYDEKAYNSRNIIQRYWQRRRYRVVMGFLGPRGLVGDLGCGSSKIIQDLPLAVAVDLSLDKLRYIRKKNKYLVNASLGALPFKNESFSSLICSQVIEHTQEAEIFAEMHRILAKGGILVLGTPDYSRWRWRVIEFLYGLLKPGGYKDKHIVKYSRFQLENILINHGFSILDHRYICGSEFILKARKDR
jgi:dolichol-phosphate mannosyltransferase